MIAIALVDNGSLEPAATLNLRRVAAEVSAQAGTSVAPVSWKHSDRVPPAQLGNIPAQTLRPWLGNKLAAGSRDFLFLPFFISAQGAIGSALAADVAALLENFPEAHVAFADGVATGDGLSEIVAERIRSCGRSHHLRTPSVVVVDHGGPAEASAILRDTTARQVAAKLGNEVTHVGAASMEGEIYPHAHPLLAEILSEDNYCRGDVVIAPLFLSPGRHAGPHGDLAQICVAAEEKFPALKCHFTELVGTHPLMTECLVDSLQRALSAFSSFGSA